MSAFLLLQSISGAPATSLFQIHPTFLAPSAAPSRPIQPGGGASGRALGGVSFAHTLL